MTGVNCHIETWNRLRKGDENALLELYNQHYVGLMNYGIKITGSNTASADSINQLLLRLWDNRNNLPPVVNVRSYLLSSLRNELLSEIRRENTRMNNNVSIGRTVDQCEKPYDEYLIQLQDNIALKKKLTEAFKKLTEREKELLKLKFFEDMDYDQIAATCNITKRTAYNIIHSAIKTLKAELHHEPAVMSVSSTMWLNVVLLAIIS